MNKIYLSLLLFIIYFGLTVLIFKAFHIIAGLFSLQLGGFKDFLVGLSVAGATVIALFQLIKRKIIHNQTKSSIPPATIRITIFTGVVLLVCVSSLFGFEKPVILTNFARKLNKEYGWHHY